MLDPAVVGAGIGARLADVTAVIERQSAFVFDAENQSADIDVVDASSARDFVLRAVGAVADPLNYRLLMHLAQDDASAGNLGEHLELGRTAVWERINDLVQVGIVGHDLEQDRVGLTMTGSEFVRFVETTAETAQMCATPADR